MEFETILLLSAAILFLIDLIILSLSALKDKRKTKIGFLATIVGFGLVMLSYGFLLQAFLGDNFQVAGVYSHSSSRSPLLSKVYASWAGAGGSMLFLTVLLSIIYFLLRLQAARKSDSIRINVCRIFSIILIIFIIVCLIRNPFERSSETPIEGLGLNPQLQSLWMIIHPPIVFSAYAFVVLAYALTLVNVKSNRELDSSNLLKISTYLGWLLLTLGIALGGVWAYEVLGWGGYWAWDPVETASLLPWLFLTAFFIAKRIYKKSALTGEFMIMVTFASLIFLSALTRGGFTKSVHSYAISAVGPIMLGFAIAMIGYFFYLQKNKRIPLFKLDVNKSSLVARSSFLGFWALIFIAVVCLVGLAFPNFGYSFWTFPFVLVFVVSLIGFGLGEKTHYARVLMFSFIALIAGVVITLCGFPNVNILTTLTVPLLILAFFTLFYRLCRSIRKSSLQHLGQYMLSFAIVILLVGVFFSAGAKTSFTANDVKENVSVEALQLGIELSNFELINGSTKVYNEQLNSVVSEFSTMKVDVIIRQSERTFRGVLAASFYPNYGLVLRPLIIPTESGDLYLHLEYSEPLYDALYQTLSGDLVAPESVSFTVQKVPMIYLVWTGVTLMLFGMLVWFSGDLRGHRTIHELRNQRCLSKTYVQQIIDYSNS